MPSAFRLETGFSGKPKALRRAILEALRRRDRLTAADIAGAVYSFRRVMVRPGWRRCTVSELVCTRRALRKMVAKGLVQELPRWRRRKLYSLSEDAR